MNKKWIIKESYATLPSKLVKSIMKDKKCTILKAFRTIIPSACTPMVEDNGEIRCTLKDQKIWDYDYNDRSFYYGW